MERKTTSIEFRALGTDIRIQLVDCDSNANLNEFVKNFYAEKEKIFSRFEEKSELSYLNANLFHFNPASCDIIDVAEKALEYNKKSQGYFDPRVIDALETVGYRASFWGNFPSLIRRGEPKRIKNSIKDDLKIESGKVYFGCRMDFSGLAKGYITDQAALALKNKGLDDMLVDSGGDIRVVGNNPQGEKWKVALEGFPNEEKLIELSDELQGVATSGISRRKWESGGRKFHHLINPKDPGRFNFDLRSVTVLAKNAQEADAWAKTLFIMGSMKGKEFSEKERIRSIFLDYKGNAWISSTMKENIL